MRSWARGPDPDVGLSQAQPGVDRVAEPNGESRCSVGQFAQSARGGGEFGQHRAKNVAAESGELDTYLVEEQGQRPEYVTELEAGRGDRRRGRAGQPRLQLPTEPAAHLVRHVGQATQHAVKCCGDVDLVEQLVQGLVRGVQRREEWCGVKHGRQPADQLLEARLERRNQGARI